MDSIDTDARIVAAVSTAEPQVDIGAVVGASDSGLTADASVTAFHDLGAILGDCGDGSALPTADTGVQVALAADVPTDLGGAMPAFSLLSAEPLGLLGAQPLSLLGAEPLSLSSLDLCSLGEQI
jgi:hypothetical protein